MKIFVFELKWPRTQKGIIKKMLLEFGQIDTKRKLKKEGRWHSYDVNCCIYKLIHEGAMDFDLYRLYIMQGQAALKRKLLKDYKLNPYQLRAYMDIIRLKENSLIKVVKEVIS